MAGASEHRELRAMALSIAGLQILDDYGDRITFENLSLERIKSSDWDIVHPAWRTHPARKHLKIDFNWLRQRNKRRDKLDVSIWYDGQLCGLFLAKHSRKRINVALRFLESNPFSHGLTDLMIPIGLILAESFATAYGASQVLISQPVRELVPDYRVEGYELVPADIERERRGCRIRAKVLVKTLSRAESDL